MQMRFFPDAVDAQIIFGKAFAGKVFFQDVQRDLISYRIYRPEKQNRRLFRLRDSGEILRFFRRPTSFK